MSTTIARAALAGLPARAAGLALGVFVLGLFAVATRPAGTTVAVWWPAAALSVGVVALARRGERPTLAVVVLLASALANLAGGRPPLAALAFGVANAAEAWVVVLLLTRRTGGVVRFDAVEDGLRLLVCSVAGAGLAGALSAVSAGPLLGVDPVTTFRSVAFSHAAALVVMTPLMLLRRPRVGAPGGRLEAGAQWTVSAALAAAVFWPGQALPLGFLPLTALVWGATRLGSRTAAAQLLLLALGTSGAVLVGGGPMTAVAQTSAGLAVSVTQLFLVSYGVVLVPLAMAVQQRREQDELLRGSEELFRASFDEALVGMLVLGAAVPGASPTRVVRCNPVAARMLATTQQDLVGSSWPDRVDPQERPLLRRALEGVADAGLGGWRGELLHRVHGEARWMETSVVALPDRGGGSLLSVQLADVTARRAAEQGLRELALHDALTGLPNRVLLTDRVEQALREDGRNGGGVALLFCDLDGFKEVNDAAGHAAGDELLLAVSDRLRGTVRPGDTVARLGGDEFVVLCPGVDRLDVAESIATRLVAAVSPPAPTSGGDVVVGVSVGIALSRDGSSVESLLRDADAAMYESKRARRPRPAAALLGEPTQAAAAAGRVAARVPAPGHAPA